MTTTLTTTNGTFNLAAGLHEFTARPGAVRCDDCKAWADAGDKIRHSKRCDTPTLQAVEQAAAPTAPAASATATATVISESELEAGDHDLRFSVKNGQARVLGPSSLVVVGAVFGDFVVASVGREFAGPRGKAYRYGYKAARVVRHRCDECGYSDGSHRMDCALGN